MADWIGNVIQGAVESSHIFVPQKIKVAIRSGPIWKRLIAIFFALVIAIVGVITLIFVAFLVLDFLYQFRKPISSDTLIYEIHSNNSLRDIEQCLSENWTDGLNLRSRVPPSSSTGSVVRVGNSIRHIVIDIHDKGSSRTIKVYSRSRKPLYQREIAAIDRCRLGSTL